MRIRYRPTLAGAGKCRWVCGWASLLAVLFARRLQIADLGASDAPTLALSARLVDLCEQVRGA